MGNALRGHPVGLILAAGNLAESRASGVARGRYGPKEIADAAEEGRAGTPSRRKGPRGESEGRAGVRAYSAPT